MNQTILWQRVEGAIIFVAGILLFIHGNAELPWWIAFLIFFAPDLSFFGYLLGPKIGALGYNTVHVYAFGVAFLAAGLILSQPILFTLGTLWLAHSGFDRMLGYGLKTPEGFSFTHLGRIGKQSAT